jgi:hypothetical protein
MKWFTLAVMVVNLCVQWRRWLRKRKGLKYEPITQLKLS